MQAAILLLLLSLGNIACELYYHITPSPSVPCSSTIVPIPCLTLSQFLSNSSNHISSNTTLIFLSGNHSLDVELLVGNANAFSMLSISTTSSGTVLISCTSHVGVFKFENISSIHISGITFYGCINSRLTSVDHFFLENSSFIGHVGNKGTALELYKTTARLVRTSFRFNVANKLYHIDCPQYQQQGQAQVGGAIVSIQSNVSILYSVFEGNNAVAGGAIFHTSCNVTVINDHCAMEPKENYCESGFMEGRLKISYERALKVLATNQMNITHCEFIKNHVTDHYAYDIYADGPSIARGGAAYVVAASVFFIHSKFLGNTAHNSGGVVYADIARILSKYTMFINNTAPFGGVVLIREMAYIIIAHSNFITNSAQGAGGNLYLDNNLYATVTITHSYFSNNSASGGGFITVNVIEDVYSETEVSVSYCEFINNFAKNYGGVVNIINDDVGSGKGVPDFYYCTSILNISHSRFIKNEAKEGGVIYLEDCPTYVNVTHSVFINNNSSSEGGVMALFENRQLSISHSEFVSI